MAFLLALLMLLPDREAILETVRLQAPEAEPMAAVEGWMAAMAGKDTIGFEANDINRLVFRGLAERLDADGLLRSLLAVAEEEYLTEHRERILGNARTMARSPLFYPLFAGSPLQAAEGWQSGALPA